MPKSEPKAKRKAGRLSHTMQEALVCIVIGEREGRTSRHALAWVIWGWKRTTRALLRRKLVTVAPAKTHVVTTEEGRRVAAPLVVAWEERALRLARMMSASMGRDVQ